MDIENYYSSKSHEDRVIWEQLREKEVVYSNGRPSVIRKSLYHEYPKRVRHYLSLFPNHFVDPIDLISSESYLDTVLTEFKDLMDSPDINERSILNFIRTKEAYFIIGGILKKYYYFGHHGTFIFPEFRMVPDYLADYLIVGKNSDGYHFVFVELEAPYGTITLKDGSFGETIRKGIRQIDDWEMWQERNFSHLKLLFERYKNGAFTLPPEFTYFDKSRVYYVIVSGRRKNYSDVTYRLRRTYLDQRKLCILHYDNLIDVASEAIGTASH
jgi:hypothetical protein